MFVTSFNTAGREIAILTWLDNVQTILLFTFILSGHRKFCLDIFYFEIFISQLSYYKYNVCLHFRKNAHLSGLKLVFIVYFSQGNELSFTCFARHENTTRPSVSVKFPGLLYFRINE